MFLSRFTAVIATTLTVSILSTPTTNAQSVIPAGNCAIITGASQDIQQILETLRPYQSFTRPLAIQSNNGFYAASAGIYPDFMAQNVLAKIIAVLIEQIVREQILVKLGNFKIGQATTLLSIERLITAQKRQRI